MVRLMVAVILIVALSVWGWIRVVRMDGCNAIPYVDVDIPSDPEAPVEARIALLFGPARPWAEFLEDLQGAVRERNAAKLAAMARYPVPVYRDTDTVWIASANQFIEQFPRILDEDWREAVLDQSFDELFVNYQGCMIGSGEVWFTRVEVALPESQGHTQEAIRIIAVNISSSVSRITQAARADPPGTGRTIMD